MKTLMAGHKNWDATRNFPCNKDVYAYSLARKRRMVTFNAGALLSKSRFTNQVGINVNTIVLKLFLNPFKISILAKYNSFILFATIYKTCNINLNQI